MKLPGPFRFELEGPLQRWTEDRDRSIAEVLELRAGAEKAAVRVREEFGATQRLAERELKTRTREAELWRRAAAEYTAQDSLRRALARARGSLLSSQREDLISMSRRQADRLDEAHQALRVALERLRRAEMGLDLADRKVAGLSRLRQQAAAAHDLLGRKAAQERLEETARIHEAHRRSQSPPRRPDR